MNLRFALLTLSLFTTLSRADDWPQWLGPQRDGVWRETGIVETFPAGGPVVRWRVPIGGGYSGPAVADGRVYFMDRQLAKDTSNPRNAFARGHIPGTERVVCLNEADGKQLWVHEYDCPYTVSYAAGPRTTPVVSGGKVYALGAEGNLMCLDAATGKEVWAHDFKKDFSVATPTWGFSGHPLIDGQKLICLAGGEGSVAVAYDKNTGKELWRALSAREPGYAPPVIFEAGGKRQLIIWHPQSLNSLDPETGAVYWSEPGKANAGMTIATPRKLGDLLYVTSFYNGSVMMRLDKDKPAATKIWQSKKASEKETDALHTVMSTPFLEDGHIYGVCSYGELRCLKADTGERLWSTRKPTIGTPTEEGKPTRWGNAFLTEHADRFFIFNEKGELIIAKLTPKGYEEIDRAAIVAPTNKDAGRKTVWVNPAFAGKKMYVRNDLELVCVDLAK